MSTDAAFVGAAPDRSSRGTPEGRIGPNAIIQLAKVVEEKKERSLALHMLEIAGLSKYAWGLPEHMVGEHEVASLFLAVRACNGREESDALLDEAGKRTADYIIANRIPRVLTKLLPICPAAVSARLLLRAIKRHAWTFAGSGHAEIGLGTPLVLAIGANPVATDGCAWHRAILGRLFQALVSPKMSVRHPTCCARGDGVCRFEIGWWRRPDAS